MTPVKRNVHKVNSTVLQIYEDFKPCQGNQRLQRNGNLISWCSDHFNTYICLLPLWLFRFLFPSSYPFLSQFSLFRDTSEITGTSQRCPSHQNHFTSRCSQCSYLNTGGALPLIVLCDAKVKITSKIYKSWQRSVISKSSWKCHYS